LEHDDGDDHKTSVRTGRHESLGRQQCDNDADKSVSSDERLRLTGLKPGRYDVILADTTGRICTVRDVELKAGGKYALSLGNDDLKDCSK